MRPGIADTQKLRDLSHAHPELRAMLERVNDVWERRGEITPRSREKPVALLELLEGEGYEIPPESLA